ncbi:MAG: serine hydrolase, partial [Pseudomonadota bacterium]
LDSRLIDFLSADLYPEARELIVSRMTESPTAGHLIGMASGIPWCEYVSCSSRDTLKMNYGRREDVVTAYIENLNTLPAGEMATPGSRYNYSAGNAVLIQAMMRTFLGDNYENFFKDEFFAPMGITDYRFERDGTGLYLGGSSLFLNAEDLAKVGALFLNGGLTQNGSELVDAHYVQNLIEPNRFASGDETPAEIKIWEGPIGSSLWINRRLPGVAQFMPRVPESMYYGAGFYGQRLMMFPEHKTPEQQSFDGVGLGLTLTRLGAEPPLGPNSYSSHWNVTVEKFYQCFSGSQPVLEVPEERKNLPSACRSPQLTTLEEEVDFTKEFALNLYPYLIQSLEMCNCVFVQDNLV